MMTNTGLHPLVSDYLARLSAESRRLPDDQARELVADLNEHIIAGLAPDATEADVRNLLDRLGSPAEVVEAASPGAFVPATAPTGIGAKEIGAVIGLIAAEILALLVPIAAILWLVGLVLLAVSSVWSGREKLRGMVSLGTGFPLVVVVGLTALMTARVTSCVGSTTSGPASTGPANEVSTCTSTGPGPWVTYVMLAVLAAYLVYQVLTARALLKSRG